MNSIIFLVAITSPLLASAMNQAFFDVHETEREFVGHVGDAAVLQPDTELMALAQSLNEEDNCGTNHCGTAGLSSCQGNSENLADGFEGDDMEIMHIAARDWWAQERTAFMNAHNAASGGIIDPFINANAYGHWVVMVNEGTTHVGCHVCRKNPVADDGTEVLTRCLYRDSIPVSNNGERLFDEDRYNTARNG